MNRTCVLLVLTLLLPLTNAAHAANDAESWAWGENIGWMDFASVGLPDGLVAHDTYLTGYVRGENVGWLFLGNGPASGSSYTQAAGDTGINRAVDGKLSGYAWGENIGWIKINRFYHTAVKDYWLYQ